MATIQGERQPSFLRRECHPVLEEATGSSRNGRASGACRSCPTRIRMVAGWGLNGLAQSWVVRGRVRLELVVHVFVQLIQAQPCSRQVAVLLDVLLDELAFPLGVEWVGLPAEETRAGVRVELLLQRLA